MKKNEYQLKSLEIKANTRVPNKIDKNCHWWWTFKPDKMKNLKCDEVVPETEFVTKHDKKNSVFNKFWNAEKNIWFYNKSKIQIK